MVYSSIHDDESYNTKDVMTSSVADHDSLYERKLETELENVGSLAIYRTERERERLLIFIHKKRAANDNRFFGGFSLSTCVLPLREKEVRSRRTPEQFILTFQCECSLFLKSLILEGTCVHHQIIDEHSKNYYCSMTDRSITVCFEFNRILLTNFLMPLKPFVRPVLYSLSNVRINHEWVSLKSYIEFIVNLFDEGVLQWTSNILTSCNDLTITNETYLMKNSQDLDETLKKAHFQLPKQNLPERGQKVVKIIFGSLPKVIAMISDIKAFASAVASTIKNSSIN